MGWTDEDASSNKRTQCLHSEQMKAGHVVLTFNPALRKQKQRDLCVPGQLGLHTETQKT